MKIVLYRRNLSLTSGAGQLIRMQAEGLRAAGREVRVASRRGRLRFFLGSGLTAKRATPASLRRLAAAPAHFVVDHGLEVPEADLVYVHNLMTEALRHVERPDWAARAAEEARFFERLRADVPLVANSELVRRALVSHFSLAPERIAVHYPGYDAGRFGGAGGDAPVPARPAPSPLRCRARAALGVDAATPLVGLVTSGELDKRGLDIFVAAAERIRAGRPGTRFLVVGGKRLPAWTARHPLLAAGDLLYRPKGPRPERWFAALDLFLFPAHFEEFGMVVSEAQASGLPVLTSRRVGAAECLPAAYGPWLLDAPDADAFAAHALALLDDEEGRKALVAAGRASIGAVDRRNYVRRSVDLIIRCAADKERRLLASTA